MDSSYSYTYVTCLIFYGTPSECFEPADHAQYLRHKKPRLNETGFLFYAISFDLAGHFVLIEFFLIFIHIWAMGVFIQADAVPDTTLKRVQHGGQQDQIKHDFDAQ